MSQSILLVEPDFPVQRKSKNHNRSIPVGLLKLASYHRSVGDLVRFVRGCVTTEFCPDQVFITSLFTYWSEFVWDAVKFYKQSFPQAKVVVGGIYATLMPDHCKESGCDEVFVGLHPQAESFLPAYDLVDTDTQIIHTSRGCRRRCSFCGVWRIEPEFTFKESIIGEICENRILFYDNDLLANPHIRQILIEIADVRIDGRMVTCESQCGIDGRLLTTEIAELLKQAHFRYPRIAWDHQFDQHKEVRSQIDLLRDAGYGHRDIYVFMLYNYDLDSEVLERKREKCLEWGVQIADCRYRPLDQTFDNYSPHAWRKGQTEKDYYIHPKWTDDQVRSFRKEVREQNIVIRHGFPEYSREKELEGRRRKRAEKRSSKDASTETD